MPKLKNFLQDLGSAVVPAAVSAGLTYASGGTINPATTPGLLALLGAGGAGARGFAANEEEERRRKQMRRQAEENRRAQGTANLINALQPGTGARARPAEIAAPKAGLGETVARGTATGIQAYTMARQAQEAWKERERQRVLTEQQIATGEEEAEIRKGRDRAVADLLRRDKAEDAMVDLVTQQRDQLVGGPRRQIQTEAAAMSTLGTSPETFDPRLYTTKPKAADLTTRPAEPLGSERGVSGAGPGFGTPSSKMQAAQDMMGGQPAPLPTGPAAVGYYQVMAEDRDRRIQEGLNEEGQDLQRRRLELDRQRAEDRSVFELRKLEADNAAHKATKDFMTHKRIDDHRTAVRKEVQGFSSVKRLAEFRSNHQAMLDLIQNIKNSQAEAAARGEVYDIRGTDQIALLNFYQNMIDPATVKEGDVHLYRTQAQGLFSRIETDLGVIFRDESGVVSDRLLKDMEKSLIILKGGYETAASEQIGHYFQSQVDMGYELIPEAITTGLRDASFTAYNLPDPVESRAQLEKDIDDVKTFLRSSAPEITSTPESNISSGYDRSPYDTVGPGSVSSTVEGGFVPSVVDAEGSDLSASTEPFRGVTTSADFAEAPQLGAVTADTDFNLDHLYDAIVVKESSNDHTAINPDSGAIGLGQVMPSNIPVWSMEILGRRLTPEQFAADPQAQAAIIRGKLEQFHTEELQNANGDPEIAIKRVAARWYSGDGDNFDSTKPQGDYPTVQRYANSIYDSVIERGARRETSATPTEDTTKPSIFRGYHRPVADAQDTLRSIALLPRIGRNWSGGRGTSPVRQNSFLTSLSGGQLP